MGRAFFHLKFFSFYRYKSKEPRRIKKHECIKQSMNANVTMSNPFFSAALHDTEAF